MEIDVTENHHLLVVDDEPEIRDTICEYFELQSFVVHEAANGDDMRAVLLEHPIDLVLLDLRMPGEDGFTLCRELRAKHSAGVIMLTGSSDTVDKIVGLEIGADDYVSKPFDLRELLARVKSVLRRMGDQPREAAAADRQPKDGASKDDREEAPFGACRIDLHARVLRTAGGDALPLSAMDFDLLKAFMDHPRRVLTRDQLLDLAHNRNWDPYDRSIDVRITRLRKRVEPEPSKPRYIKTVRGVGYMYSPEGE
jgi:two-component system phosphate regulon response regulator OmpR